MSGMRFLHGCEDQRVEVQPGETPLYAASESKTLHSLCMNPATLQQSISFLAGAWRLCFPTLKHVSKTAFL